MPDCPKCLKNITYIINKYSRGSVGYKLTPTFNGEDGGVSVEETDEADFDDYDTSFEASVCPECWCELFDSDEDRIKEFFKKTKVTEKFCGD